MKRTQRPTRETWNGVPIPANLIPVQATQQRITLHRRVARPPGLTFSCWASQTARRISFAVVCVAPPGMPAIDLTEVAKRALDEHQRPGARRCGELSVDEDSILWTSAPACAIDIFGDALQRVSRYLQTFAAEPIVSVADVTRSV